jgi:hypothetical protein
MFLTEASGFKLHVVVVLDIIRLRDKQPASETAANRAGHISASIACSKHLIFYVP